MSNLRRLTVGAAREACVLYFRPVRQAVDWIQRATAGGHRASRWAFAMLVVAVSFAMLTLVARGTYDTPEVPSHAASGNHAPEHDPRSSLDPAPAPGSHLRPPPRAATPIMTPSGGQRYEFSDLPAQLDKSIQIEFTPDA